MDPDICFDWRILCLTPVYTKQYSNGDINQYLILILKYLKLHFKISIDTICSNLKENTAPGNGSWHKCFHCIKKSNETNTNDQKLPYPCVDNMK